MTDNNEACIYLITNLINRKKYIGQSKYSTPNKRWQTHVKSKHLNNYFLHAFNLEMLKKDRTTRRRKPKVYLD